jgi:hypothetical protein
MQPCVIAGNSTAAPAAVGPPECSSYGLSLQVVQTQNSPMGSFANKCGVGDRQRQPAAPDRQSFFMSASDTRSLPCLGRPENDSVQVVLVLGPHSAVTWRESTAKPLVPRMPPVFTLEPGS